MPFSIPCKLLLKNMTGPDDGRLDQLICGYDDFDAWKQDPVLASQITETAAGLHGEDCDEFFDYCVPTSVFENFMRTTPARIKAHTYCDLRFDALLTLMTNGDQVHLQEIPWLIVHHKISMDMKQECFDSAATGSLNTDTRASMSVSSAPEDAELVSRFRLSLTPEQVAIVRRNVQSVAIQHIGCKDELQREHDRKYEEDRALVVAEINSCHKSPGFGEALWAQSCELFAN